MQIHVEAADAFNWWNAVTTFLSVILGAALAYFATHWAERRRLRADRITKSTLLFLKFRNVVDGLFKIDRQLREGIDKAAAAGVSGPVWTQMEEISAIGDYEEIITIEDLAVLAENEHFGLIQSVSELRDGHNGVVRALAQLFAMKNELGRIMPPNAMQGNVAVFAGVPPPAAMILMANLDALGTDIVEHLGELMAQARAVSPEFHRQLKLSLKVKKFPMIELPHSA